ncbi:MAG: integrin alpha [Planctomycetota bacterium]|jgi:hypothetical protein|nr:integrin alpha [Planctomycetota bacterium]
MKTTILLAAACSLGLFTPHISAQSQDDWVEWAQVDGTTAGEQFGSAIVPIGDVNNDNYDDFLVASPTSSSFVRLAGEIAILSGQDNSIIASASGTDIGQQIGYELCVLGEHDGDGMLKIAASSPFSHSTTGFYSGIVNIYAFDLSTLSLDLWQEIPGPASGSMFGVSLAALDNDGDGDLDLAVGSLGDGDPAGGSLLDGSVSFFNLDQTMADGAGTTTSYGALNSGEMFGFSLAHADSNGTESVLVGAPFAGNDNQGAAVSLKVDGSQVVLIDPNPTANANLGFDVASGGDLNGDGFADYVASAPNTGTGSVITWIHPQQTGLALMGDNQGEKFGYSIAVTADSNFDDNADLVVGAPEAATDKGRFAVHDMSTMAQSVLYSANGSAGQLFGSTVATGGDLNQTTKSEVLVGAIGNNNSTGRIYIYSPPEQDSGPIEMDASGAFEWETDVTLTATNLSAGGGGQLYWYMGTQQGSSTSAEGYDLDITGNVSLIATTSNPGVSTTYDYNIPDSIPDGQSLVFQVVEDRSGFIRSSTLDGGNVIDPGVTMFIDGDTAGDQIVCRTKWGIPNSPVYLYASKATPSPTASNLAPDGNWALNLRNSVAIGSPGDQSDLIGNFSSTPINVPANLSGVTGYFQAYDWDFFEPALTRVVTVTFQ